MLFNGDNVFSYKVLTLEFLSTLEVITNRTGIRAIRFRKRNDLYEMTMEDFKGTLGSRRMTIESRMSSIEMHSRGQLLRMIQKACAGHPFARSQQDSMQRDELFLLWSLLHKRSIILAHYMIKHLERASKKDKGTLCSGGVIGSIALHLGVDTDYLVRDIGESRWDQHEANWNQFTDFNNAQWAIHVQYYRFVFWVFLVWEVLENSIWCHKKNLTISGTNGFGVLRASLTPARFQASSPLHVIIPLQLRP
ncbi:uncharacterized protein LOC121747343 [Salvia splendens]|uniref:uncharacterized protein LOC121747343 n=1 Tax=Salvia splendens TaxID=180675 RepID=UPI001C2566B9|nr:uncharacterized protein LOC121747343 [Salvia splendens]XP_041997312.1 uncharacterized protein LOC121747343 [Salvia splendens]XP_041997313.1 uncharacterized protein LOC121747343 [Salvia splendens]XP_041997314.1 uncharacterized protein LOC121747343 [Salvia splendens]